MALTAQLPPRPVSRAAKWTLRLAVFIPILSLLSILAHRNRLIESADFLILIGLVGALAAVALILFCIGLRSLWVFGTKGGKRLSWALVLLAPFIGAYLWAAATFVMTPTSSDISTDMIAPPLFAAELRQDEGPVARALAAGGLADRDVDLAGRRFTAPLDATYAVIETLAARKGWRVHERRGRIGADDDLFLQYTWRTPVLNMPVELIVRATDEGDTVFVDARARMPHVTHDLGYNARLIQRFLADLDFAMIGVDRS